MLPYALTIFLGALLLRQVQALIAKYILRSPERDRR